MGQVLVRMLIRMVMVDMLQTVVLETGTFQNSFSRILSYQRSRVFGSGKNSDTRLKKLFPSSNISHRSVVFPYKHA